MGMEKFSNDDLIDIIKKAKRELDNRVIKKIDDGISYRTIAKELNCSVGKIAKIYKELSVH